MDFFFFAVVLVLDLVVLQVLLMLRKQLSAFFSTRNSMRLLLRAVKNGHVYELYSEVWLKLGSEASSGLNSLDLVANKAVEQGFLEKTSEPELWRRPANSIIGEEDEIHPFFLRITDKGADWLGEVVEL